MNPSPREHAVDRIDTELDRLRRENERLRGENAVLREDAMYRHRSDAASRAEAEKLTYTLHLRAHDGSVMTMMFRAGLLAEVYHH